MIDNEDLEFLQENFYSVVFGNLYCEECIWTLAKAIYVTAFSSSGKKYVDVPIPPTISETMGWICNNENQDRMQAWLSQKDTPYRELLQKIGRTLITAHINYERIKDREPITRQRSNKALHIILYQVEEKINLL